MTAKKTPKRKKAAKPAPEVLGIYRILVEFVGIGRRVHDVIQTIQHNPRTSNIRSVDVTTIRGRDGWVHPSWIVNDNGTNVQIAPKARRRHKPSVLRSIAVPAPASEPAPAAKPRSTRRNKK